MTPGTGRTSTNRAEGNKLVFKQLVRSCRRWQLYGLQLVLRGGLPLGMHTEFRDPRRSQVAPNNPQCRGATGVFKGLTTSSVIHDRVT